VRPLLPLDDAVVVVVPAKVEVVEAAPAEAAPAEAAQPSPTETKPSEPKSS